MLAPDYLDTLPDALVELFQQVEDDILRDIARRINKMGGLTSTAAWQAWRLEQARAVHSDVVRTLAKYSGKADAEIRRILQDAGATALAADDTIYRVMGFAPSDISTNPALLNLLNAGYRQTLGSWKNLTRTTANTVTRQFEDALDRAWLQVSSGAFDYKTAVKRAVDDLASKGIKAIRYPSGHTDTLEVAARRAVLTGVYLIFQRVKLSTHRRSSLQTAPFFGFFVAARPGPFIKRTAPPYTSLEACGGAAIFLRQHRTIHG